MNYLIQLTNGDVLSIDDEMRFLATKKCTI